ncbi:MAG: SseB family protein [Thermodesulfobacteriota bacterium]|nr:SseB family protein [Thermodesulfobacteriota bacterium]
MTKLDEAIKLVTQDSKNQPHFYDLFLNSIFYIPVVEEKEKPDLEEGSLPLLVEANDKIYLMLFDTIKRLTDWADEEVRYLPVQGYAITELSASNIYWVLNYGTELQKFFDPEEIGWLKNIVRQTKEKNEK